MWAVLNEFGLCWKGSSLSRVLNRGPFIFALRLDQRSWWSGLWLSAPSETAQGADFWVCTCWSMKEHEGEAFTTLKGHCSSMLPMVSADALVGPWLWLDVSLYPVSLLWKEAVSVDPKSTPKYTSCMLNSVSEAVFWGLQFGSVEDSVWIMEFGYLCTGNKGSLRLPAQRSNMLKQCVRVLHLASVWII